MNFAIYQVLIILFCVLLLSKATSHYLRKEQTIRELLANYFFWGLILSIAIMPNLIAEIARLLGFKDYLSAVVFFIIMGLVYVAFSSIMAIDGLKKEITDLTRKLALKEAQEGKNKKSS